MRTLGIGIAAAITLAAAVTSANAQGLWIGAPGFGVGIGVGPTPYYGGYRGGPYWGAGYGYDPSYVYQGYAYEPEYGYDTYVPDDGYVAYSNGPGLRTYAYDSVDSYGYAPRLRYSRNYAYSPERRATRTYSYDTRGIRRDHRSTIVHNTRPQDHAVTQRGFAVGAERENAGSRQIRPEASRALARAHAHDLRQSKSIESGKTENGRVRTPNY